MDKPKASFQRPRVITSFSVSSRKTKTEVECSNPVDNQSSSGESSTNPLTEPAQSARYICQSKEEHAKVYCSSRNRPIPITQMDLNAGFESVLPKENESEKIDILLMAINQYASESRLAQADIVCYRGALTKIAASPYDFTSKFDDGWIYAAEKRGNTIYLCEFPTKEAAKRMERRTDKDRLMAYWGHKFETYICSNLNAVPQPNENVDLNDEFCLLVTSKLDELNLLFVAEVDCHFPEDPSKYIELKTSRRIENDRQFETFCRFKLYKWWLQSFLVGIEDILCGFRDDDGRVVQLEWFKVSQLHQLSQHYLGLQCWDSYLCLNFLSQTLRYVKESVVESNKLYLVSRSPGQKNVTVLECSYQDIDKYSFMSSFRI